MHNPLTLFEEYIDRKRLMDVLSSLRTRSDYNIERDTIGFPDDNQCPVHNWVGGLIWEARDTAIENYLEIYRSSINLNARKSYEREISRAISGLIQRANSIVEFDGNEKSITNQDILIVAPYNVQVNTLSERLPEMRIGTVDKFQGQEAPIVIYSMTSSSPEDAPRGMSFLYNPNRLNVATSRAQCISILVASPSLLEPECHSVDQMRWANGLCRYKELAAIY